MKNFLTRAAYEINKFFRYHNLDFFVYRDQRMKVVFEFQRFEDQMAFERAVKEEIIDTQLLHPDTRNNDNIVLNLCGVQFEVRTVTPHLPRNQYRYVDFRAPPHEER